ncbi:MAG: AI-2E family transporter [Sandaracinaceae bacterium]
MKLGPGAKTVLMLAGVTAVLWGLYEAASVLVPLVAAVFVTVVSLPIVTFLTDRKVPRWIAVLAAVTVDLAVVLGFAGLVGGTLNEFYDEVPTYQARLRMLTEQAIVSLDGAGFDIDPDSMATAVARIGVMDRVVELFQRVWALGSKAFLVSLLVLFMLVEAGTWKHKMAYVLQRPTLDLPRFTNAAREVQTYLVVKSGLSVITGLLCGAWVAICGVDFALLWGLFAFFLNYIPTLGMFIATVPPVLLALIQYGPASALLMLGGYGVINFTLGNLVEPRVMGKALGLSPLVVFLSMVFWWTLWGPVGALLAVPLTMAIKILLASTEDLRWAAVLLGSEEWFEAKRREWEDPYEAERRRSILPPEDMSHLTRSQPPLPPLSPIDPRDLDGEALLEPDVAQQAVSLPANVEDSNPPLHTEDEFSGSGLRPKQDPESSDPGRDAKEMA